MEILLLLIPLSAVLMGASAYAFLWAVRRRQFEQLERHALDIFDDESNQHGSSD
jgi:cbb3-type cytochrome oxidase maturation protein